MSKTKDAEKRQKSKSSLKALGKRPSRAQLHYLRLGLDQAGGKLPLFDKNGQRINPRTINSCLEYGWCERWFSNPIKPEWLVCRLTAKGKKAVLSCADKNKVKVSSK